MDSQGLAGSAQSTEKAFLTAQTVYSPGDFENQLCSYLLFGKGLMQIFYTPVSTSVLNEILLVKHLEQSLACK